jgi:VWFA-related protein
VAFYCSERVKRDYHQEVRSWLRQLLGTLLATLLYCQEPAPIRVPVRLVVVPTLVFGANGRIVSGLDAQDFSLFDNGVSQKFELQTDISPPSVAIAIQANSVVSEYLPMMSKIGTLLDSLLVGEGGRSAILTYGDEIEVLKPFGEADSSVAMKNLAAHGYDSHMLDAGMEAVSLLKQELQNRPRVLLFIGQAADSGSGASLSAVRDSAARADVSIHCLTLPIIGKKFVAETFSVAAKGHDELGGFAASADLMKLVPALRKAGKEAAGEDPFSVLVSGTGGTEIHFRRQTQLENGLIAIGTAIRSSYVLTYQPRSSDPGYHRLLVVVDVPHSKGYSRPGYWRDRDK